MADSTHQTFNNDKLNAFIAEMQRMNAARDVAYNYNPVSRQQNAVATMPTVGDIFASHPNTYQPLPLDNVAGSPSTISRILDIIERPLYTVANIASDLASEMKTGQMTNISQDALAGFTGKSKKTFVDVLKSAGASDIASSILGTVGNLGLDPINLIGATAGKAAITGIKALTSAGKLDKAAQEAADLAATTKPDFTPLPATPEPPVAAPTVTPTPAPTSTVTPTVTPPAVAQSPESIIAKLLNEDHPASGETTAPTSTPVSSPTAPRSFYQLPFELIQKLQTVLPTDVTITPDLINSMLDKAKLNDPEDLLKLSDEDIKNLGTPGYTYTPTPGSNIADKIATKEEPVFVSAKSIRSNGVRDPNATNISPETIDRLNTVLNRNFSDPEIRMVQIPAMIRYADLAHGDDLAKLSDKEIKQIFANRLKTTASRYDSKNPPANRFETPADAAVNPAQTAAVKAAADAVADPTKSEFVKAVDQATASAATKETARPPITLQQQSSLIKSDLDKAEREVRATTGSTPGANDDITRKLIESTYLRDTANTNKGLKHVVSTTARADSPVPVGSHNLRMSDVFDVLGQDGVKRALVSPGRMHPTVLLKMAARAVDYRKEDVTPLFAINSIKEAGLEALKASKVPVTAQLLKNIDKTARILDYGSTRLVEHVANADAIHAEIITKAAGHVVHDVNNKISSSIDPETGSTGEAVKNLSNVGAVTNKAAQGNEEVAAAASRLIAQHVSTITNAGDVRAAKLITANIRIMNNPKLSSAEKFRLITANMAHHAKQVSEDANKDALSVVPADLTPKEQQDISIINELDAIGERLHRPIREFGGVFSRNGRQIAQDATAGRSAAASNAILFTNIVTKELKKFAIDDQRTAMRAIQDRVPLPPDSSALPAFNAMKHYLDLAHYDTTMDKDADSLLNSLYSLYPRDDIERVFRENGIKDEYWKPKQEEWDKAVAANPEKAQVQLLADWSRRPGVIIDDPVDFITRHNTAAQMLAYEQAVASHFTNTYASAVRHPGFVRMPETLKVDGGSRYWQKVQKYDNQGKPVYYHPEALKMLADTERNMAVLSGMTKAATGPLSKFMQRYYDPLLTVWKTMVTIARPGFLVRNFNGDMFLNFGSGMHMWSIRPYKDAVQVMKAGGVLSRKTIDSYEQLLKAPGDVTAVGKFNINVKTKGGKVENLNDRALFNLANSSGVLPSYHATADVLSYKLLHGEGQSWAQNLAGRVQKLGYMQKAASANEVASNYPRMAQFMHHMRDPKFTSKYDSAEEAARAAGVLVRKHHPDVTMLSPSGQRYGRRVIPFYSWSRLTTPLFAEALVTKPWIMTMLPKMEYGYQEATGEAGGHPANMFDLYDPTRLLPSYARETMGTLGGNYNFDLGTSPESLATLLNSDPGHGSFARNILDMINPVFKTPIELATGKQLANQQPITSIPDYLDPLIPGISEIGSVTGYSPIGTINNIINGGAPNGKPFIDNTRSMEQKNRQRWDTAAIANFLLGLGIHNVNAPGSQRLAQREYRSGL